jgi:diacylglycerol kinase (ATP)
MNDFKSRGGIGRIVNAIRYSLQGFAHALRYESAFRQELCVAVPATIALWFLPVNVERKMLLLATLALVLIAELLNSAVEAAVDRTSLERHPLAGRAKDLGSAAVMLSIMLLIVTWAVLAGPALYALL